MQQHSHHMAQWPTQPPPRSSAASYSLYSIFTLKWFSHLWPISSKHTILAILFQIWRPVSVDGARYLWVNETMITALWVGYTNFLLRPIDRFPVQRGDVLGLYYPKYNPIPWSSVSCRPSGGDEILFKNNPQRLLKEERETTFEHGGNDLKPCRRYSLNATILDNNGLWGINSTRLCLYTYLFVCLCISINVFFKKIIQYLL